ncbi:MAG: sensor histidine kinase [Pirellulales bacterium]
MLWLPQHFGAQAIFRLPLADSSAPAWLWAMAEDGGQAAKRVCEAIKTDPALALWLVCAAGSVGCENLRTADALAAWLAVNCRCAPAWPETMEQTRDDAAWRDRYRRLAAVSLAVATCAGQLAMGDRQTAEQAFLLGLLHEAEQWRLLDPTTAEQPEGSRALPDWLARSLERLSQRAFDEGDLVLSCVARARDSLDETAALRDYDEMHASGEVATFALAAVAQALPAVAKQLAASRTMPEFDASLEAAKLSAMAEFAAGAGHEINNPIAVIAGRAQLLLDGETNPQRRHELAVIHSQAMRVYEMIADMMLFARPSTPKFAACDLNDVVHRVVNEIRPKAVQRALKLNVTVPNGPLVMHADATQLAVAVRVVCDNALAAVEPGGQISIHLCRVPNDGQNGAAAVLEISDSGPGIPDHVRPHLFEPFYSGRQAGRGLGMGLAKAWRVISGHRGRIDVTSQAACGTTFCIILPDNSAQLSSPRGSSSVSQ